MMLFTFAYLIFFHTLSRKFCFDLWTRPMDKDALSHYGGYSEVTRWAVSGQSLFRELIILAILVKQNKPPYLGAPRGSKV